MQTMEWMYDRLLVNQTFRPITIIVRTENNLSDSEVETSMMAAECLQWYRVYLRLRYSMHVR